MTASLREAAQAVLCITDQVLVDMQAQDVMFEWQSVLNDALEALRAALVVTEAEPEPVAVVNGAARNDIEWFPGRIPPEGTLLYVAPVERKPLTLTDLNELAKVYASSYASPHHIKFTVEGLRNLIEAHNIKAAS